MYGIYFLGVEDRQDGFNPKRKKKTWWIAGFWDRRSFLSNRQTLVPWRVWGDDINADVRQRDGEGGRGTRQTGPQNARVQKGRGDKAAVGWWWWWCWRWRRAVLVLYAGGARTCACAGVGTGGAGGGGAAAAAAAAVGGWMDGWRVAIPTARTMQSNVGEYVGRDGEAR
jgi:hypothetical protein